MKKKERERFLALVLNFVFMLSSVMPLSVLGASDTTFVSGEDVQMTAEAPTEEQEADVSAAGDETEDVFGDESDTSQPEEVTDVPETVPEETPEVQEPEEIQDVQDADGADSFTEDVTDVLPDTLDAEPDQADRDEGGNLLLNANNFPDAKFLTYVKSSNWDQNNDGALSADEIAKVTDIDFNSSSANGIKSIAGIKYFTSLKNLTLGRYMSTLEGTLDLSDMTSLAYVNIIYVSLNITSVDLSGCTSLIKFEYSSNNNSLTNVDLSGCTSLVSLFCYNKPNLNTLDITDCQKLTYMDIHNTGFHELDLHDLVMLEQLTCSNMSSLEKLDVSGCSKLNNCNLSNDSKLSDLNMSNCISVKNLTAYNSGNGYVYISGTNLETINASGCKNLEHVSTTNGKIKKIDVSNCTLLNYLNLYCNELEELNVSGCTALNYMDISYNKLTSLDVSGLLALSNLDCNNNALTSIKADGCNSLNYLEIYNNLLLKLDFANVASQVSGISSRQNSPDFSVTCSKGEDGFWQTDLHQVSEHVEGGIDFSRVSVYGGSVDPVTGIVRFLQWPGNYLYYRYNTGALDYDSHPGMLSVSIPMTGGNAETIHSLPVSKGALVLDGSKLDETTRFYIQADPVRSGHKNNGNTALRFVLQVYNKNGDGTYTPATSTYDANNSLAYTWDMGQRDTTSLSDGLDEPNLDWHDNRLMVCSLSSNQVAVVYPVSWNDNEDSYTWFPSSNWSDPDQVRSTFMNYSLQDEMAYSFSYKVGLKYPKTGGNFYYISSAACDTAKVSVTDGTVTSTSNIRRAGEIQTVTPEVKVSAYGENQVLSINFDGITSMDDSRWEDFAKSFRLLLSADGNGMNGGGIGNTDEDKLHFTAKIIDKDNNIAQDVTNGTWTANKNSHYYFNYNDNFKINQDGFRALKDGGKLVIYSCYPVYSMSYAVESDSATGFDYTSVNETYVKDGKTVVNDLKQSDEYGYSGTVHVSSKNDGVAGCNLTVTVGETTPREALGFDENGLPNFGLRFVVETSDINRQSYSNNIYLKLNISPESYLQGMGGSKEQARFRLVTYKKDSQTGKYVWNAQWGDAILADWNGSSETQVYIDERYFAGTLNELVFVLLPVDTTDNFGDLSACRFNVQVSGTVLGSTTAYSSEDNDYEVKSYQTTTEEDPLSASKWTSLKKTGAYNYSTPVLKVSSEDENVPQVHTLKINVSKLGDNAVVKRSLSTTVSPDTTEAVIIRNHAVDYEADTTDNNGMPDVKVTIHGSEYGLNTGNPCGWGESDSQLPFRAYIYNYDDESYTRIDDTEYYSFDKDNNPIKGPASTEWGVQPESTNYFHTHLADNQAIVIAPASSKYSFSYEVTIMNPDQYSIQSASANRGIFRQTQENLYASGTIGTYGTKTNGVVGGQEVVLDTVKTTSKERGFDLLSKNLPSGQKMVNLPVTLFDYDFPGLTKTDFSGQSATYKFLYDPLNNYDFTVNHIGNNKTKTYTGIVQDYLDNEGLPVFNYGTPFNLFESSSASAGGGTKSVQPAQFQFVYNEATQTYSYNSHLHHAQLGSDGVIRQYTQGLGLTGWGSKAAGFFPFNDWETAVENDLGSWGTVGNDNYNTYLLPESELDYHFGMSMNQDFGVPENGYITLADNTKEDMVFKISGDDDIWMFIDGHLVLDIGGIHESITGEVNLTEGTYTVNGVTNSLSSILPNFENFGGDTGDWAWGTMHQFQLFYLERGGTLSNMDVSFNLPTYNNFTVGKTVQDTTTDQAFDFELQVYKNNPFLTGEESDKDKPEYVNYEGKIFEVDSDGNRTELKVKDGNYSFKLKDGETRSFCVPSTCHYVVTERAANGYTTSWKSDHATGTTLATDYLQAGEDVQVINTWTPEPTATPTPVPTSTPVPTVTPTPDTTITPEPSKTPSVSPSVIPTPSVTKKPTKVTATPEPTEEPDNPGNGSSNGGGYGGGSYSHDSGSAGSGTASNAKTGDDTPVAFWICVLAVSGAAGIAMAYRRRKVK